MTGDAEREGEPGVPETVARRLVVHGRVQGVFFRDSTRRRSVGSGVVGWVANRADGTVEVWLEGARPAVEHVQSWIHGGGPDSARVSHVDVEEVAPVGHTRFEVVGR